MAALDNLPHFDTSNKPPISKAGVLTVYGFGVRLSVQSGHLEIEDGIGPERRKIRLARVGHKLRRLVCISEDGFATLSALKWLGDVGASFVMLDRTGRVLLITGPTASSDIRLRRAQALAHMSGAALRIARELIDKKLAGQEHVARQKLFANQVADTIHRYRSELAETETLEQVRLVESMAAGAYWSVWRNLPMTFPRKDEPRVPAHWRSFGARVSPLTGSPRLAVNPPNAILNYLYAVLESEARLAAAAMGLDPEMGVLHVDTKARDSLACDLMEPVRPEVDAFLLDWITRDPLKREWFFEQRDGNCRLMTSFAVRLSETAPMWGRAIAPIAESVARLFWASTTKRLRSSIPPTRLTQRNKREAKSAPSLPKAISPPRRENVCRGCGLTIREGHTNCANCSIDSATERLLDAAQLGRVAARSPEARAKHMVSRQRHASACSAWDASTQPSWLTSQVFSQKIQPLLANISTSAIRTRIGVSRWYAGKVRKGYRPHPRHWQTLAMLVGVTELKASRLK